MQQDRPLRTSGDLIFNYDTNSYVPIGGGLPPYIPSGGAPMPGTAPAPAPQAASNPGQTPQEILLQHLLASGLPPPPGLLEQVGNRPTSAPPVPPAPVAPPPPAPGTAAAAYARMMQPAPGQPGQGGQQQLETALDPSEELALLEARRVVLQAQLEERVRARQPPPVERVEAERVELVPPAGDGTSDAPWEPPPVDRVAELEAKHDTLPPGPEVTD